MHFIAHCPFCRRKVQAPEHALGRSVACKRCGNHFTLAPTGDDESLHGVAAPSSVELEINFDAIAPGRSRGRRPKSSHGAKPASPSSETVPQHKPLTAPSLPVLSEDPPPRPDGFRWHTIGVVAMCLGSLALGCASVGWLQWLTVPLSALGLIAGAFGLIVDYNEKTEEWTPRIGAVVSGAVLLLALAWPALLGLDPRITADLPPPTDPNRQVLVTRGDRQVVDARAPAQPVGEQQWVEADLYDVDHGSVRVRVQSAGVQDAAATLKGRRGAKEYVITLLVSHVGTKDAIPFGGWRGGPGAPRLVDASGKPIPFRPRTDAAQAPVRSIVPFRPLQETLAFDVPAPGSDFVRLELPASAFGGAGTVRLQIPRTVLQRK